MKISEIRAKKPEELKDMVLTLKKEQFNLRMQAATGALENRSRIKEARKDIARAKTVLGELANPNHKPVVAKVKKEKKVKTETAEKTEKTEKKAKAAPKKAPAKKVKKG